ncbi:hypothetical protein J31TS4_13310 [Paenibacillus sp. J31TS4]|nr:hypothetical protein J31TS4_13310 [Paenibacillus sp. J31TS4]
MERRPILTAKTKTGELSYAKPAGRAVVLPAGLCRPARSTACGGGLYYETVKEGSHEASHDPGRSAPGTPLVD